MHTTLEKFLYPFALFVYFLEKGARLLWCLCTRFWYPYVYSPWPYHRRYVSGVAAAVESNLLSFFFTSFLPSFPLHPYTFFLQRATSLNKAKDSHKKGSFDIFLSTVVNLHQPLCPMFLSLTEARLFLQLLRSAILNLKYFLKYIIREVIKRVFKHESTFYGSYCLSSIWTNKLTKFLLVQPLYFFVIWTIICLFDPRKYLYLYDSTKNLVKLIKYFVNLTKRFCSVIFNRRKENETNPMPKQQKMNKNFM